MPDILTFAYTPANHLKFNSPATQQRKPHEDAYSDYAQLTSYDEDDHVLVLEMDDSMVRKKRFPSDSQVALHTRLTVPLTSPLSQRTFRSRTSGSCFCQEAD